MSAAVRTLLDLLRARADAHDQALAFSELADDGSLARTLTFGELEKRARALAGAYRERASAGARVVLAEPSTFDFVQGFFGLIQAGLVPVPAPAPTSRATTYRLLAQARDCGAVAWIGPAAGVDPAPLAHLERWGTQLPTSAGEPPPICSRSDDLAFLQYTSGSTSAPRGVVVTHRAILANERDIARAFEHDDATVFASWLPPFHDMGLIGGILQPLYLGIPCHLMTPLQFVADPGLWLRAIDRYRVTTSGGPNFAYELCVQRTVTAERERLDLSSWRVAFNGAEPVRADTLADFAAAFAPAGFRRSALVPCYGLAEATLFVAGSRAATAPMTRPSTGAAVGAQRLLGNDVAGVVHVSSGRPADSLEVAIVDPTTARSLPDGEEGEIWIAGESVADRYFGDPGDGVFDARLSTHPALRFLRSGDLGFISDGELFVTGRIKDLLLVQGRNVHPTDVEIAAATVRVCDRSPLIAAVEDPSRPGGVVVIVEVPRGAAPAADAASGIRAAVADECGVHVQTVVLLLDGRLPRTTSGKLRRAECARLFAEGSLGATVVDVDTAVPARDTAKRHGVEMWEILADALSSVGLEPPTRAQRSRSPVEQGLSSLDATRLASALARMAGVTLPVGEILGARSFEELVDRLREGALPPRIPEPETLTALSGTVEAMASSAIRDRGRVAENISIAVSVPSGVSNDACRRALVEMTARHPSLRTTLLTAGGGIEAQVRTDVDPRFEQKPTRGPLADALVDLASQPFDLATGPLLRACMHHGESGDRTLQLLFHHAAVDFWSLRGLFHELDAALRGEPVREPVPVSAAQPTDQARAEARRYWREAFPDAVSPLALPAARPTGQRLSGRALPLALSRGSAQALRQCAAALAVTPAALQLAAFQALLALYGGCRQVITAVPFLNRDAATLDAVCCRVNVLPVVGEFDEQASFGDLARAVNGRLLELQRLQEVPFAEVGTAVAGSQGRSPVTQFGFVPYDSPGEDPALLLALRGHHVGLEFAGARSTAIPLERFEPNADLLLATAELGDQLLATIEFDAERLREDFARDFASAWQTLMSHVAFEPRAMTQTIKRLSAPDRAAISLTRGSRREPRATSAFELFERRSRGWPDLTAVEGPASSLSYRELLDAARAVRANLEGRGIGAGERVAVTGRSQPELVAAILGMWSLGAVYCPVDPDYPEERRRDIEACLGARMTVQDPSLLLRSSASGPRRCTVRPEDPAYVIFTSGSTGRPKGVALPHRGLVNTIAAQSMFGLAPGRRVLQAGALGFDASIFEIVLALFHGATLVIPSARIKQGSRLTSAVEQLDIDCAVLSPSLIAAMEPDGPAPRTLIAAGEACPDSVVRAWASRCELYNAYGPTECSIWATVERLSTPRDEPLIGAPICNVDVAVVDEQLRPVPLWVPGELVIGGCGIGLGYLGRADARFLASVDVLAGAPGYRTGDRVRMRSNRRLEFIGRNDRQVKVRGVRIELGEVEAALGRCRGVQRAVALLLRPQSDTAAIAAAVTATPGEVLDSERLRDEVRGRLPPAAVPVSVRVFDRLPLDVHGKLDARRLRALFESAAKPGPRRSSGLASRYEQLISSVCQQVLDVAPAGTDTNLLELGVHSLNAARIAGRLSQILRREVPVSALFAYPEVGALAAFLDDVVASQPVLELRPQRTAKGGSLRPTQRDLWLRAQLASGDGANVVALAFRVRGPLEVSSLEVALDSVIVAHPGLRSHVALVDGVPRRYEDPSSSEPLAVIDLSEAGSFEAAARVRIRRLQCAASEPESLGKLHAVLLRKDGQESILALVCHHLSLDGWSAGVLLEDLSQAYSRALLGRKWDAPETLPSRPGKGEPDMAAWRAVLAGYDAAHGYAPDPDSERDPEAATVEQVAELDTAAYRRLVAAARRCRCTPFVLAASAFAAVAARQQGREEVVVGVVAADRDDPGSFRVLDCRAGVLPIRLALAAGTALQDLAREFAGQLAAAAELGFPQLSELTEGAGHGGFRWSHLLAAAVTQNDTRFSSLRLSGLSVAPLRTSPAQPIAGLLLEVTEHDGRMSLRLEADGKLFGAARARDILDAVREALTDTINHRSALGVSRRDRHRVLERFNRTTVRYDLEQSLVDLLEKATARDPDAIAVRSAGRAVSYREFGAMTNRLANALLERGARSGHPVAVCCESGLALVVAAHGVVRAGASYLALDPRDPARRTEFALRASGAEIVVTDGSASFEGVGVETVTPFAGARDDPPSVAVAPDSHAYVLFTSGSTGQPKAVANTHAGIVNRLLWMQDTFALEPGERVLHKTTATFDVSVWELFWPLIAGATLCIAPPGAQRDAALLYCAIRTEQVTTVHFVPSALSEFLRSRTDFDLPSLRRMLLSGEALDAGLVRRAHAKLAAEVHNLYGPTEAAIDVTHWHCARGDLRPIVPIGKPIANTRIYVVDTAGEPAPTGVPGELVIAGAGVAAGYLDNEELTRRRFGTDRFDPTHGRRTYATGDRARWTREGVLEFLGRDDDQVKLAGVRVEPAEIVAALEAELAVAEAIVVAEGDGIGRRLVAYVVAGLAPLPQYPQMRERLATRLPSAMLPAAIVALPELPLLPNGKLDRRALALEAGRRAGLAARVEPSSDHEHAVLQVWRMVLEHDDIGVTDTFFEVGGTSALLMRLHVELMRLYEDVPPLVKLLEAVTIREQAGLLVRPDRPAESASAGQRGGSESLRGLARLRGRQGWPATAEEQAVIGAVGRSSASGSAPDPDVGSEATGRV